MLGIRIYQDLKEEFADNYTVVIDEDNKTTAVYTMSHDALSPNGVNMYYGDQISGRYLTEETRRIRFMEAPRDVQVAALRRIEVYVDP